MNFTIHKINNLHQHNVSISGNEGSLISIPKIVSTPEHPAYQNPIISISPSKETPGNNKENTDNITNEIRSGNSSAELTPGAEGANVKQLVTIIENDINYNKTKCETAGKQPEICIYIYSMLHS